MAHCGRDHRVPPGGLHVIPDPHSPNSYGGFYSRPERTCDAGQQPDPDADTVADLACRRPDRGGLPAHMRAHQPKRGEVLGIKSQRRARQWHHD
jgi:hypothetical protein